MNQTIVLEESDKIQYSLSLEPESGAIFVRQNNMIFPLTPCCEARGEFSPTSDSIRCQECDRETHPIFGSFWTAETFVTSFSQWWGNEKFAQEILLELGA